MAKGSIAKENLIKRFATAVGEDFICEKDKKFYFWSTENGERVQVAVSMTVPKTPVECTAPGGDLNFESESASTPAVNKPVEMGEDEKATLDRLMAELGLN